MHYLVVEDDAEVVGYAAASSSADIAELQRIAVRPTARGAAALATALLDAVSSSRVTGRADRLLLEVREDNAGALAFYAAAASSRSTGGRATTATAPTRSCMRRPLWRGGCG